MSESKRGEHRTETTVRPVRRQERPAEAFDGEARPPRGRRLPAAVAAAVLILAAIAVFVYLPSRVEQERAKNEAAAEQAPPAVAEPAEPAKPPLSRQELAALRQQAEDLLAELLEQRQQLEDRSADSWGEELWESYATASRRGDDALLASDVGEAVEQYRLALKTGESLFERSREIMTNALTAGDQAIEAGNSELARNQFALVLTVDPENQRAQRGQKRAENLPAVLDAMRRGDALTKGGDLDAAANAYREALATDPNWEPARTALASVTARIADNRFESLITDGFSALDAKRYDHATEAFSDALAMRPDSDVASDGLAQAEQGQLLNSILMAEVRGQAFEKREMWDEAMARYREALAADPTLKFAIEGLDRAQYRADLEAKLKALVDTPNRLLNDDVLGEARQLLEEARKIEDPGPAHESLTSKLADLIEIASTPISVTLVSDDATEVTVYRVGELGTFNTRQLELKPGQYIAVGSRRGYRDVRETFSVLPGRENGPVTVICEESITSE